MDRSSRKDPALHDPTAALPAPPPLTGNAGRKKARTAITRSGKYETRVTRANGGNHDPKQTRLAWAWIDTCSATYRSARLYHLSFVMADQEFAFMNVSHIYKNLLKRLMQHLRRNGFEAGFHCAREIDDGKGEHLHVFICVEAAYRRPDAILNRKPDGWLAKATAAVGIRFYINQPRDPMHNGLDYATLPRTKPEKIEDAKCWVSYLFKRRSKPAAGQVYSCSRTPLSHGNCPDLARRRNSRQYKGSQHRVGISMTIAGDILLPSIALVGRCESLGLEPNISR